SVSARELRERAATATFHGRASVIDAHPMYTWPIVESTAVLTRFRDEEFPQGRDVAWGGPVAPPRLVASSDHPLAAAQLVQGRRSAQRFNAGFVLARQAFERLLKAASCPYSPSASDSGPPGTPLDGEVATQIHLVLFVHRVDSLEPGIYLVRRAGEPSDAGLGEPEPGEPEPGEPELGEPELGKPRLDVSEKPSGLLPCFEAHFPVRRVHDSSPELELFQVSPCASRELARISRLLHCQQEIAASCCFAVAMLADVARAAELCPAAYRDLHREAGRIGHSLYLQAELEGVRGTGIGCFLDEPVAEFLGLQNSPYRSIYHFSVGQAQLDPRIETAAVEAEDT
ncbi:MAG TPA: hypothetical protein VFQ61_35795, partial [Polyangiaceae bacterium]|nr:hypothetical protein [Polyangiaceae bacterium]